MEKIDVLIIGSGGREHAIAWKISKSPLANKIFCAPGNPGIAEIAECVNIDPGEIESLCAFAREHKIGLTIVGPEDPLVNGIVDKFQSNDLKIFGPTKEAATLEGSKIFAKNLMRKHGIPTADYKVFDNFTTAEDYINSVEFPKVIKADGPAKGKGVFVCKTKTEALNSLQIIMNDKVFGQAGDKIIIEEFLEGKEVSILSFTDGKTIVMMDTAQDYKTIYDGNKGPNTGGMGAYSPTSFVTEKLYYEIEKQVLVPTIHAMKREGRPFKGLLYTGLMINSREPAVKVLEYNVRFGDPETQPLMLRMRNDLVSILMATINETLDSIDIQWDPRPAVCVVLASKGYPGKYETGKEIKNLNTLDGSGDVQVFHAGTEAKDGNIYSKGGRVLNITAMGSDMTDARRKVYDAVKRIQFEGAYWRKDIALSSTTET
ncbi:MAG: phosphoribosylamine--glycine ligase [Candidatus Anammoxibacter sp.]